MEAITSLILMFLLAAPGLVAAIAILSVVRAAHVCAGTPVPSAETRAAL